MSSYTFKPIGYIHSCFKQKFGIPRQPGLVREATAILKMAPEFSQMEAFRRLSEFSHIWVLFVFHGTLGQGWRPSVRPPRLGGNTRVGVFASRSGFRPNAIGQSAVELVDIQRVKGRVQLLLGGVDLLDGTPVLDIKPYLPYADALPDATAGYAPGRPETRWPVCFSDQAERYCRQAASDRYPQLGALITRLLSLDPRPRYRDAQTPRDYAMRLWDLDVKFRYHDGRIEVSSIQPAKNHRISNKA
jgi:tRNA-Thr(GGU) m(6)t(6)A37 methyltransferase TsaA